MTLEASDPALHVAEKTFLLEHRFSESERLRGARLGARRSSSGDLARRSDSEK